MVRSRIASDYKTSKNRSAKQFIMFSGPGTKSVYRTMSNAALAELTKGKPKNFEAEQEINRRAKKHEAKNK